MKYASHINDLLKHLKFFQKTLNFRRSQLKRMALRVVGIFVESWKMSILLRMHGSLPLAHSSEEDSGPERFSDLRNGRLCSTGRNRVLYWRFPSPCSSDGQ
jgi:uncharacterized protein with ParB-like and HNH nuclease domain